MPTEIEAKFLKVSHEDVRAKLSAAGALLEHPMRLMRRQMFDYPDKRFRDARPGKKLRLRDEGDRVTFTYKEGRTDSNYTHELETTAGSFEDMSALLQAMGMELYSYQESKRETWHLRDVEVVLDEWPWVDPYIEIEGPSEEAIRNVAAELGFDWSDAKFGSVDTAYRFQYPGMTQTETVNSFAEIKFSMPLPEFFERRK